MRGPLHGAQQRRAGMVCVHEHMVFSLIVPGAMDRPATHTRAHGAQEQQQGNGVVCSVHPGGRPPPRAPLHGCAITRAPPAAVHAARAARQQQPQQCPAAPQQAAARPVITAAGSAIPASARHRLRRRVGDCGKCEGAAVRAQWVNRLTAVKCRPYPFRSNACARAGPTAAGSVEGGCAGRLCASGRSSRSDSCRIFVGFVTMVTKVRGGRQGGVRVVAACAAARRSSAPVSREGLPAA